MPGGQIMHNKSQTQQHRKSLPTPPPPFNNGSGGGNRKNKPVVAETLVIPDSDDDDELTLDDETESDNDNDDMIVVDSRAGSATDGSIEDVCLACRGKCRCGGAQGERVVHHTAPLVSGSGLKIRLSVSTTSTPQSSPPLGSAAVPGTAAAPTLSRPPTLPPRPPLAAPQPAAIASRTRGATAHELERPSKKPKVNSRPTSRTASPSPASSFKPRTSRQTSPARAEPTPSRMTLRQVLAMSKREASASANNSDAEQSDGAQPQQSTATFRPAQRRVRQPESLSDVSDLDLLNSDPDETEDDEAIEKAEEKALRAEFERGTVDEDEDDDSDDLTDFEDSDPDQTIRAPRKESTASPHKESDTATTGTAPLPASGGLGVVTWSDYDDEDEDDLNDADDGVILPRDIERELQELVALSEAVTCATADDDFDLDDFWLESSPEDESGSAADDESGGDDDEDSSDDDDDDQEEGPSMFVTDGGWNHQTRSLSGSSAGDSDSEEVDEFIIAEDDTTDSLDSDIDLIRFGIDVGSSDETETESSEDDEPQTTSLAHVQAPTVADLASLPRQLLFDAHGMPVTTRKLPEDQSRRPANARPVNGPVRRTGNKKNGAERDSRGKFIKRNFGDDDNKHVTLELSTAAANTPLVENAANQSSPAKPKSSERRTASSSKGTTSKTPMMGTFSKASAGRPDLSVVIVDDANTFAPSPFSRMKRGKRKDVSPSRRVRADSKVSTTSNTDGSVSGEMMDVGSPVLGNVDLHFDIDDMLNENMLVDHAATSSSSEDSDADAAAGPSFMDFSRWNRIPIGAFRSSTQHGNAVGHFEASSAISNPTPRSRRGGGKNAADSNSLFLRNSRAVASLNNTLSSPGVQPGNNNRRAIERRMLTSPVFGPVTSPSVVQQQQQASTSGAAAAGGGPSSLSKAKGKTRSSSSKKGLRKASIEDTPRPPLARNKSTDTTHLGPKLRVPAVSPFTPAVDLPPAP
ncbi:hypothetical protein ACM66B_003747 [Microbotryomycetes sp. NB124-2]